MYSNAISSNPSEERLPLINRAGQIVSKIKGYDSFALDNTAGLSDLFQCIFHLHISSFWKYYLNFYFFKDKLG